MRIYSNYERKRLFKLFLIVISFITIILWITQSFRIFDLIINNHVNLIDFLELATSILPFLVYSIIPFAVLITSFIEANRMSREGELLILQSNKYNFFQVVKPFLEFSIVITCVAFFLSFYLVPKCYGHFKRLQFALQHNYISFLLEKGVFVSKIDGLTFYVSDRDSDEVMHGILINDIRNPNHDVTITANTGLLSTSEDDVVLILQNGSRQEINHRTNKIMLVTFDKYKLDLKLNTLLNNQYIRAPNEKYINQLISDVLLDNPNVNDIVRLHSCLLWPLFCITLCIVPISLSMRVLSYRGMIWNHNLKLVLYSVVLIACFIVIENAITSNISLLPIIYLPVVIPIVLAMRNMSKY